MASRMRSVLDFVSAHCHFHIYYGPAECAGAAIQYMIADNNDEDVAFLPIGRPLPNVHVYLLDKYLQPTIPVLQIGELVVGGNI